MVRLHVERIGGVAGFGGVSSHLRSRGEVETEALPEAEQRAIDALFQGRGKSPNSLARDRFVYRLTRETAEGTETVDILEESAPAVVVRCVKDEIV